MRAFVIALLLAVALSSTCPTPVVPDLTSTPALIEPGYAYDFILKKTSFGAAGLPLQFKSSPTWDGSKLGVAVYVDVMYAGITLNPRVTFESPALNSSQGWNFDTAIDGIIDSQGVWYSTFTFTTAPTADVFVTFFASCPSTVTCSSDVELDIQTVLLNVSDSVSPLNKVIDARRSFTVVGPVGTWVTYSYTHSSASNLDLYVDVSFEDDLKNDAQVTLYWQYGSLPTTASQRYPGSANPISGNYVTATPFIANQNGTWYFAAVLTKNSTLDNEPAYTFKFGFNQPPCSSASSLTTNVLAFVLAFILLCL